ncbi:uncharacterized protein [Parasteatoda tepidariorum]
MFARSWKKWMVWVTFATSITTLILLHNSLRLSKSFFIENDFLYYDLNKEEPITKNQTCQLPRVHPFDPSILTYLTINKPINCKERFVTITFIDDDGFLRYNLTALKLLGYDVNKLQCSYQEIVRKDDFNVEFGESKKINVNGSQVRTEFIYVSCHNFVGIPFYSNVHCHIIPTKLSLPFDGNNTLYNVLVIGIDSVSRLSFIRNLPKTYKFLKHNLNAFIFRGMTKVGDNTWPNLGAILMGKAVYGKELPKVKKPSGTYDSWPFIWKNFSEAGYATLFAEDQPAIGLFTYLRGGLRDPPTDHYLRPFWLVVQTSLLHRLSSNLCFGDTPKHLLQLKYTKEFVTKYSNLQKPFFGFSFLVEISHDYISQVTSTDEDFLHWLTDLYQSGQLNRTFLLFMSDHGHRFDPMRATLIGRIEERMPFLGLVAPQEILEAHDEIRTNLRTNEGRLTTPYDIYFTLLDILKFSVNNSSLGTNMSPRGTSLFGEIALNRTCTQAGIPDHYCVCEKEEQLTSSDPRSQKAADVVVSTINNMLEVMSNYCSKLQLAEIVRTDLLIPREEVVYNSRSYFGKNIKDGKAKGIIQKLRIIVRTIPGDALFESTISLREENQISILGDISRINKYGQQSSCIDDANLRKYCFCSSQNGVN